jgi:hypothetical protein
MSAAATDSATITFRMLHSLAKMIRPLSRNPAAMWRFDRV